MFPFMEFMEKGGPIMWVILLCSIIAFAIIMDRALFFSLHRININRFKERLLSYLMRNKNPVSLPENLTRAKHPVERIAKLYLEHLDKEKELREEILRREGMAELEKAEKRLWGLSIIAHITPLLGLLGTVTGMISLFHSIEMVQGQPTFHLLSGGIWEALLTTAFGLSVAVPSLMAYHFFEKQIENLSRQMMAIVSFLNEHLKEVPYAIIPEGEEDTVINKEIKDYSF